MFKVLENIKVIGFNLSLEWFGVGRKEEFYKVDEIRGRIKVFFYYIINFWIYLEE